MKALRLITLLLSALAFSCSEFIRDERYPGIPLSNIRHFSYLAQDAKKKGDVDTAVHSLLIVGFSHAQLGEYDAALDYYEQAFQVMKKNNRYPSASLTNYYTYMGSAYSVLGNQSKAVDFFKKAMVSARQNANRGSPDKDELSRARISSASWNLAGGLAMAGDYSGALDYFREALKLRDNDFARALTMRVIAWCHFQLGDRKAALDHFRQSLELNKSYAHKNTLSEEILSDLSAIYLKDGNIGEAEKCILEMINSDNPRADTYRHNSPLVRVKHLRLAELHLAKKDFANALKYAEESRKNNERWGHKVFDDYQLMGMAYEGLNQSESAVVQYEKAAALIEEAREAFPAGERGSFFENRSGPYEGVIRSSHKLANGAPLGLFYSESTKARQLSEMLGRSNSDQSFRIPSEILSKENTLINKIAAFHRQRLAAVTKGDGKLYEDLTLQIKALKAQKEAFIASLWAHYPEYAAIKHPRPVRLENIPLKDDEALLEFKVTDSATYLFVVRKGRISNFIEIPIGRKALEEKVKEFRSVFERPGELDLYDTGKARGLYQFLLQEGLKDVGPDDHVIIVPDEILSILPFETLVADTGRRKTTDAKAGASGGEEITYVGDLYSISYYPSATIMAAIRSKGSGKGRWPSEFFGVGDPVFEKTDARYKNVVVSRSEAGPPITSEELRGFSEKAGYRISRLPETADEVTRIAALFGGAPKSDVLLSLDARGSTIKRKDLRQYRYIHFATHGLVGNEIPYIQEPALVLTQVDDEADNGFLTASKILGMKLDADMVVLSACQTGMGKIVKGEGITGLSSAFLSSGARSVVVSLWPVASNATAEFMKEFYRHLKTGKSKAEALRLTKREFRGKHYGASGGRGVQIKIPASDRRVAGRIDASHPFFWSPFILIGEWR